MKKLSILCLIFTLTCGVFSSGWSENPTMTQDFTGIAKEAIPAVVFIKVKGSNKIGLGFNGRNTYQEDFWSQFFNMPDLNPRQELLQGQASGFIISPDGYILTNSHVIDGMSEIKVILNDKREFTGKIVGQDPNTDVALVKIEATNLPHLHLGNSDNLEVGQWVVAIGNPYGLQATLTVGVVSAKGRNDLDITRVEDFIQTDAAINRGNSGGPLLTLDGKVVGINTAIVSNSGSGGYMGIGFAIPSNIVKYDMDQLLEKGSVSRGFLGVTLQRLDPDLASAFNLDNAEGALIADVAKDTPAANAGLKQGDVILKYNNIPVTSVAGLRNAISLMKPGTPLELKVLHQDKSITNISVKVADYPSDKTVLATTENNLGIEVQNLTPDVANNLGLSVQKGVIVSKVNPDSLAAWGGIKKGTVIVGVNQQTINNVEDYRKAVESTIQGKPVLLLIKQGDFMRYVSLKQEISK